MRAVCCGGEDAAAPEGRAEAGAAKSVRGHREGRPTGTGERVRFLWCTAVGAGWRSLCSSCCAAAVRVAPGPQARARRAWMQREGAARTQGARALGATGTRRNVPHDPPTTPRALPRAQRKSPAASIPKDTNTRAHRIGHAFEVRGIVSTPLELLDAAPVGRRVDGQERCESGVRVQCRRPDQPVGQVCKSRRGEYCQKRPDDE